MVTMELNEEIAVELSASDWKHLHLFACQVTALRDYEELLCYANARLLDIQTSFFTPLANQVPQFNIAIAVPQYIKGTQNGLPEQVTICPATIATEFTSNIFQDKEISFEIEAGNPVGQAVLQRQLLWVQNAELLEVIAPLYQEDRLEGVLYMQAKSSSICTPQYQAFLTELIKPLPAALFNARRYSEVNQKLLQFQALRENTIDLVSQSDPNLLLELILERAINLLNTNGGVVYLIDRAAQEVECLAFRGDLVRIKKGRRHSFGVGVGGKVAMTEQTLVVNNFQIWEGRMSPHIYTPVTAMVGVPLRWKDETIGVLTLTRHFDSPEFSTEEVKFFELFAAQASATLAIIRLYSQMSQQAGQLTRNNQELEAFFTYMNEGFAVAQLQPHRRIIRMNPVGLQLFGWGDYQPTLPEINTSKQYKVFFPPNKPVQQVGTLNIEFKAGEAIPFHYWAVALALEGYSFNDFELLVQGADGIKRHLTFSGSPIRDEKGTVVMAMIIFRDVTAAKQLEQVKDDFLALVSHDLRNPLAAILGYNALVEESLAEHGNIPAVAVAATHVQSIQRLSEQLNWLVLDLLDMALLENGKLSLEKQKLSLGFVVREVVNLMVETHPSHSPNFHIEIEPNLPYLHFDWHRIEQVLNNLVSNALKFSPEGSPIIIKIEHQATTNEVLVSIKDDGIGIDPEALPYLFNRFYRAKSTNSEGFKGVGLGLYLCRLLIEAHRGKIWAESPGLQQGSTFFVALPTQ